jgi:hypothetical protein
VDVDRSQRHDCVGIFWPAIRRQHRHSLIIHPFALDDIEETFDLFSRQRDSC